MCNSDLKKNILNAVVANTCFYSLCANSFIDCMFCLVPFKKEKEFIIVKYFKLVSDNFTSFKVHNKICIKPLLKNQNCASNNQNFMNSKKSLL